MSNSYTPGPPSSGNYRRSNSIDDETETGSFDNPAPNRSIVGTRNNDPQAVSERNLADGESYYGQVIPSISDVRGVGGISASGDSGLHQSDAPNFDGHVRPKYSQPGQENPYSAHQAPGISGQARPNRSESAQPSPADDPSPPVNPQDYAGISLVGKKFKEVNPTAYYVEK